MEVKAKTETQIRLGISSRFQIQMYYHSSIKRHKKGHTKIGTKMLMEALSIIARNNKQDYVQSSINKKQKVTLKC